jgi:hypothetical protein
MTQMDQRISEIILSEIRKSSVTIRATRTSHKSDELVITPKSLIGVNSGHITIAKDKECGSAEERGAAFVVIP